MSQYPPPPSGRPTPPQNPQPPYGQPAYGQQPPAGQPSYGQQAPGQSGFPQPNNQPGAPPSYGQAPQPPSYPSAPYGQQLPSYPGAPGYGAQSSAPAVLPQMLKIAVILMLVGAALSVISGIFSLLSMDQAVNLAMQKANTGGSTLSPDQVKTVKDIATTTGMVGGIAGIIVGTALWVWMAFANRAGKKWARILSTVFAGIFIISSLYSLISGFANQTILYSTLILTILSLLVSLGALVLIWLKPSSEYYAVKSQKPLYG
ncbi:hypothetical protein [Psychromicrobium xiongbiense]|uniref:hypothetical protein n=1 Tax=Psychromicrobium xiongbiense TaxID=3051184 RepID=UPI0025563D83|nr:hypothetical protein [Psychromicrobium sp. YIM S02556]